MKYAPAVWLTLPMLLLCCDRRFESRLIEVSSTDDRIRAIEIEEFESIQLTEISVYLNEDLFDSLLIKKNPFEPFWPSITLEEARELAGVPDRVTQSGPEESLFYATDLGKIEISYADVGSWETHMKHRIKFYPTKSTLTDLFSESLIAEAKSRGGRVSVTILGPDGFPEMTLALDGGDLKYVVWIRDYRTASKRNKAGPARTG